LLKKPKIPIDVITIRTAMAANKYDLIKIGARVQFSLSHTVAISLLTSNATPITIIGVTAAAKILTSPATEYQMATADMVNPLSNARYAINLSANVIFIDYYLSTKYAPIKVVPSKRLDIHIEIRATFVHH
jgi:hypothetical protein